MELRDTIQVVSPCSLQSCAWARDPALHSLLERPSPKPVQSVHLEFLIHQIGLHRLRRQSSRVASRRDAEGDVVGAMMLGKMFQIQLAVKISVNSVK